MRVVVEANFHTWLDATEELTAEEVEEYNTLSDDEKKNWLKELAYEVALDHHVQGFGDTEIVDVDWVVYEDD